ncbi:hypothetical protein [Undibacterium seohonense]|uniref:hypothetical protein n=1 Tax=Undibacterium seohonense TaxID=1344950 RepID=UPI001C9A33D3|nr:hypothetical protein [Undibacterium seohonense]
MVTTAKKKAPVKAKAPVVPAKTIANAAAKAVAIRSVEDLKAPVAVVKAIKSITESAAKVPTKSAAKAAPKPAAKAAPKAAAKTPAKTPAKPASKVLAKAPVKLAAKSATVAKASAKKPAASNKPAAAPAKEKVKKPKLVRDSFTMPEAEYAVLGEVKKACISAGIEVKKSQLLRVGLVLLKKTPVSVLKTLIEELPPLKAGRPKLG